MAGKTSRARSVNALSKRDQTTRRIVIDRRLINNENTRNNKRSHKFNATSDEWLGACARNREESGYPKHEVETFRIALIRRKT
jgi:hypothetical protein